MPFDHYRSNTNNTSLRLSFTEYFSYTYNFFFLLNICSHPLSICLLFSWPQKTLESPLHSKEIKSVNPKGNQLWIFIRTKAKGEAPILGPPDAKSQLTRKDWCWERLRAGREGVNRGWNGWMASLTQWTWVCQQTLGNSEGEWSLVCCSPWSHRVRHDLVTEKQQ